MSQTSAVLAAVLSDDLAADARDLAARIRAEDDPRSLRKEAAELVQRLTAAGLEAFFLDPVRRIGLGTVTQSMVKGGLATSAKAIGVLVRRIVGGLSAEQVVLMADVLDETLVELQWNEGEEE